MEQNYTTTSTSQAQLPTREQLDKILKFDTCTIANAIECFGVRLRNEGFTRPGLSCLTGADERVLGYAATFQVRSMDPPTIGGRFTDRTDYWSEFERLPCPRIAVFENMDGEDARGGAGEVHAAILKAFGCDGLITDGMACNLHGLRKLGLSVFAKSLTVSDAYMHIVDFGKPVEIMGLGVKPGDLLYADCHGVLTIPIDIVPELPAVAERIHMENQAIIKVCQSPDFSPEMLLNVGRCQESCRNLSHNLSRLSNT